MGRAQDGLDRLAEASAAAHRLGDLELQGLAHGQHGLILIRNGRLTEAAEQLSVAVILLVDNPGELCRVLLNRSTLHLNTAALRQAELDATRCAEIAREHDLPVRYAKALDNLGYLELLRGDLPAALRLLDDAHRRLVRLAPAHSAVVAVDRARALRSAGLAREAEVELAAAIGLLRRHRLNQDLAEAELVRAEVALLDERPADAQVWARRAHQRFRRRGNETWAGLAELLMAQAWLATGQRLGKAAQTATRLAGELRASGLDEDARAAELVAAQAQLARGCPRAAATVAGAVRLRAGDRIGTRLMSRLVRAELAGARGDLRRRQAELRDGLRDLHRYQARFGSLDLRVASALHARRLAALGLAGALADGRAPVVFAWVERTRALVSRLPPVQPPPDARAAELLAELRGVRKALREAELAGRRDQSLRRRRLELEHLVRQRAWYAAGGTGLKLGRPVPLGQVAAAVGDGCLVSFLTVRGQLHALVCGRRGARLFALGEVSQATGTLRRVRADLGAAAMSKAPAALRAVVGRSLRAGLRRLDDSLWRPLSGWAGEGPVVIVPTSSLSAVPWTCLPGLRGRPISVAPSATWWLAARDRHRGRVPRHAVFAAGPGVARGEAEVRQAAAVWSSATVLTGAAATAATVLAEAGTAGMLHVAAHGVHEPESPLFSCIQLADGPLFGYDLSRAASLPPHVVLSACELGLGEVRAGDEALGMTTALLHGGAVSVVAGVGRVQDDAACEVMIRHHKALHDGASPAYALADAVSVAEFASSTESSTESSTMAPFVCFGAAW
ncbi:MAG TPA: CHAT domain-containing protein [Pseudonocardiaceae bacterium]|nr:CHAT domain-containing protein [Pseudonocardiaceae bacterium]